MPCRMRVSARFQLFPFRININSFWNDVVYLSDGKLRHSLAKEIKKLTFIRYNKLNIWNNELYILYVRDATAANKINKLMWYRVLHTVFHFIFTCFFLLLLLLCYWLLALDTVRIAVVAIGLPFIIISFINK